MWTVIAIVAGVILAFIAFVLGVLAGISVLLDSFLKPPR